MNTPATTPATGSASAAPGAATRLRNGELRRMVAEQLTHDRSAALTPGAIANQLGGKSSGAVGNALATLEARGEAERVGTTPVTYRATDKTADAAKTATVAPRTTAPAPSAPTESTAAPPAVPALVTGPVRRPNGQMYHPRKLSGLSDVTALAVVYPAMDGRRQIIIKTHKNEVVDAAPGFYVVAGHNPGVHGAVLTDALSSRFSAQIHVSTDYDLATQLKIDPKAVRVARNLSARQDKGEIGWAPQLRELIAFNRIADVLGTTAAAGNLVGIAPEEDREVVAEAVRNVFGANVAPLSLGPQF